jgi:ribosomal protein S6--L-glutamate ligase
MRIGLWMYRNSNGDRVQATLRARLEAAGAEVWNDFDLRDAHVENGRVYAADGRDLSTCDLLFHMNADEQTPYELQVLRAAELSGVRLVNSWRAFERASDKFLANLLLRRAGVPVPEAALVDAHTDRDVVRRLVGGWGGAVVKARFSFGGKGVIRFTDADHLLDYIQVTRHHTVDYYIEQFVPFSERDYRVEVIDDRVVGSYSRGLVHAYKTNMSALTNLSQARFLRLEPSEELLTIGLRAASTLGLDATIVDAIRAESDGRLYVIEVNCMLGIFVEAANEALGITGVEPGAYALCSDARKMDALTALLLDRARSADRAS